MIVIVYGVLKKQNVYDLFIEGSKESFDFIFSIFPSMLAMIFGVNIFLKSNIINYLYNFFSNIHVIPPSVFPLMILRPISGSASLAVLNNILKMHGPDSFCGILASVVQGSTDTTFYVITLYFGSVGIKKVKYAFTAGLFADLIGIISSILIVKFLF